MIAKAFLAPPLTDLEHKLAVLAAWSPAMAVVAALAWAGIRWSHARQPRGTAADVSERETVRVLAGPLVTDAEANGWWAS